MTVLEMPGFWVALLLLVGNMLFLPGVLRRGRKTMPATMVAVASPTLHVGGHATFHAGKRELVGVVKKICGQRVRIAYVGRDGRRHFVLRKAHEVSPLAS